jgi:hypothetical protein
MTVIEFRAIYPQFAAVSDAVIQYQLNAFACLYQGDYGCSADYLAGLFVAHQVAVATSGGNGAAQSIASKSVGDVSISYNKSAAADKAGDFGATKYGMEFARLMGMFGMGPIMAGAVSG